MSLSTLIGTQWSLSPTKRNGISNLDGLTYNLTFTDIAGTEYNSIVGTSNTLRPKSYYMAYDNTRICTYQSGGLTSNWNCNDGNKLVITITGGTDATNTTLIEWFETYWVQCKKISKAYIGISNQSRKILKGYIGDENNQSRLFFNSIDSAYLTFESSMPFSLQMTGNYYNGTMQFSTDTINWRTWTGSTISSATYENKYSVFIRGSNNTRFATSESNYSSFVISGSNVSCNGNIETLLDYQTVLLRSHPSMADYAFNRLFAGCSALVSAPELPTNTLSSYCYYRMFFQCTSLTTAPELPATTLTSSCYERMFSGCSVLASAPELPAMSMASSCYLQMFRDCLALTTAPELPATTVASNCYNFMFGGCTALTTAPSILPATTAIDYCYCYMFGGCTSLTTTPILSATTMAAYCYNCMFLECSAITTPPSLPATTLADNCYSWMFHKCTSLTTLPKLPATKLVSNCYNQMFKNASSIKIYSSSRTGATQAYRIPTSGTGTTATDALKQMFEATTGSLSSSGTPSINTTYYTQNEPI